MFSTTTDTVEVSTAALCQPSGPACLPPSLPDSRQTSLGLIGQAPAFLQARRLAERVAARPSSVLLLGETGTGKEMMARVIHGHSPRRGRPMVVVDCAALTHSLAESELFGHVRGAFTGATRDTLGFFRVADGGTLFLDEIGELPLVLQAKLLRVLQERYVVPVGDTKHCPVDVRIVAATHRDLEQMVAQGQFRQDLLFRLQVVSVRVPALKERREDVLPLAEHFLELHARAAEVPAKVLSRDAQKCLLEYGWPGNVRELANAMEYASVLTEGDVIERQHLPVQVVRTVGVAEQVSKSPRRALEAVEAQAIAEALREAQGCKAQAARMLGIRVARLQRMITRFDIPCPGQP